MNQSKINKIEKLDHEVLEVSMKGDYVTAREFVRLEDKFNQLLDALQECTHDNREWSSDPKKLRCKDCGELLTVGVVSSDALQDEPEDVLTEEDMRNGYEAMKYMDSVGLIAAYKAVYHRAIADAIAAVSDNWKNIPYGIGLQTYILDLLKKLQEK